MEKKTVDERILQVAAFLERLRLNRSVNAVHRAIKSGRDDERWRRLPIGVNRETYENERDFSKHWTAMRRGLQLPPYDKVVLPAVVVLSAVDQLADNLKTAAELYERAAVVDRESPPPSPGQPRTGPQFNVSNGGNQFNTMTGDVIVHPPG